MLKKVCILVISLFFAPVILAKSIVVGVSMYSLADKYPTYLQDSMDKFVASQSNLKFKYADANGDPAKMLNDVENFIDSKVDADHYANRSKDRKSHWIKSKKSEDSFNCSDSETE